MLLRGQPGVPHKRWSLQDVIDLHIDEGREYGDYERCQFCGQEQIRYVHLVRHVSYPDTLRVGCICAEHMTEDYVNPRRIEGELRRRAMRRSRWPNLRAWRQSRKGNWYMNTKDGHNVGIFETEDGGYMVWIDNRSGRIKYPSLHAAKIGIFDALERLEGRQKT